MIENTEINFIKEGENPKSIAKYCMTLSEFNVLRKDMPLKIGDKIMTIESYSFDICANRIDVYVKE